MTIKLRLIGIISLLGVSVVGLSGSEMLDAFDTSQNAAKAYRLARMDAALIRGMTALRFERGSTVTALGLDPDKVDVILKNEIAARRRALDEAIPFALSILVSEDTGSIAEGNQGLDARFEQWRRIRNEADAALSKPASDRDQALARRVFDQANALVTAINDVIAAADAEIRRVNPRLSNIVRIRDLTGAARNAAAETTTIVNDVLRAGGLIAFKEQLDYASLNREAAFAFNMANTIATQMGGAPKLKAALAASKTGYFEGALSERNRTLLPALADRSLPRPSVAEVRVAFNPALDLVSTAMIVAVDELEDQAGGAVDDARRALLMQGLLLAAAVLVALGGAIWVIRSVAEPLVAMTGTMRKLASGDVGLEIPYAQRRDEIGAMAGAVQVFKDNLIRTRQLEGETALARASAEEQRKAGMRQMADRFEETVGGIIGMVSSSATELQATASAMSGTAAETAAQSTAVAAAAEEAAVNVNTVAAAAEELGASVHEIGRQVSGSAELARLAVVEADRTGELVQALSGAVSRIGAVVGMISTIAGQTNLLALNATIEAARAGPAGKGFAVVAAEVKALAEQTAEATNQISTQIAGIQASTGDAVGAISVIAGRIREISGVATSIAAAVEEQGAATQEIVRNVGQAATGTSEVTGNIAGVAGAAEETGAAASQVLASASELSRQSEHLSAEVRRFLDTVRAA